MHFNQATNSRTFNEAFNTLVGTTGVTYSPQWGMNVKDGEDFMDTNYADVGRAYANELLHGNVRADCCLANDHAHEDLSDRQRAYLSLLADTTDTPSFDAALRACSKYSAVPNTACMLFSNHGSIPYTKPVAVAAPAAVAPPVAARMIPARAMSPVALSAPTAMDLVSNSPPTAPRMQLNAPSSGARRVSLKPGGKRSKLKQ
jgi:hypothetical protein